MALTSSLPSIFKLAARRAWDQRVLMLCLLVGLAAAVGLLASIPLYADAIHHRLLQGELTEEGVYRPPFSFLWRYVGAWYGDIETDAYAPADEYLSHQAPGVIGLPAVISARHVRTANLRLFPATESQVFAGGEPLLWAGLGFVSQLADHIQLIEGAFPGDAPTGDGVEVLITQALAEQAGLQVGERYVLFGQGRDAAQLPVRIAGVWRPRDRQDPFWFYQPSAFDEVLLTSEAAFTAGVSPKLERPIDVAVWYQVFDGSRVRTPDVPRLLDGVKTVEARATALLSNTTLDASPVDALQTYNQSARLLTVTLTIFGIPVLLLVLYFVGQIAGMVVRRGQGEVALMRSRGATRTQVLLIHLVEGLLVGVLGLLIGLVLGGLLAYAMGQMRSFLDPSFGTRPDESPLLIVFAWPAVWYGLAGVGLAVVATLLPALAASRHTIITFKWEQARTLRPPFWQRYFLDVLLLLPSVYGLYLLRGRTAIAQVGPGDDPFSNPLLVLAPALFCFSLALLFMRVFPVLASGLAWLADRLPGTVLLLTVRQVARSARQYTGPLLLMIITLSLATFTASMAATLDGHLHDQVYYQVGADLNLAELGESTETDAPPALPGQQPATPVRAEGEPRWLFLPVSEHLSVPGVKAAARVGDYRATSNIGGRQQAGRLLGVDWYDFTQVAFFRGDFAGSDSLGGLMNRLAPDRANLLVSRDFLASNNLALGDPLQLTANIEDQFKPIDFTVAGVLDLFPTLYPQDGPFFVANLDYVHEAMGETFPYNVWLATDPSTAGDDVVAGVRELGLAVVTLSDARATMTAEQTRPERQGPFGLLSVGFLAAAALTVLGFLVYAVVSFQRRFIELGLLRAVGLSVMQMAAFLAGEQIVLVLVGAGVGTGLGVWASQLFIPFLQVGATKFAQTPPFVVHIAWDKLWIIYAVFGVMFLAAVVVLSLLLIRMKIFEAIKLGETV